MIAVPGRICLVGEHNDWAGGAAVVVPMDRFVRVRLRPDATLSATAVLEGRSLSWRAGEEPGPLRFVPAVATVCGRAWGGACTGAVHIEGELPAGRGFSSSAAVCVALVRAFAEAQGRSLSPPEVAELAWEAEAGECGVNCGRLDPLACAWGTPLFLRFSGNDVDGEPLPAHFGLAVGSFPTPRDTRAILDTLGRHFRGEVAVRDWEGVRRVGAVRGALDGFGEEARHAKQALRDGDLRALGASMTVCQEIYEEELMPAFPELRAPGLVRAVRALREAGALGAKFSGAGGDGSVVGLFAPDDPALTRGVAALDRLGLHAFAMELWCSV
jgi:mevalonate kinase